MNCPFCSLDESRIFHSGGDFCCIWDAYPVCEGHALVIPHRHFSSWFEADPQEQQALLNGIEIAKIAIEKKFQPHGFNIGINVGEAAGQTVQHLHVHVIPRMKGDVFDPRGGVRHVIPEKANYLANFSGVRDLDHETGYVSSKSSIFGSESYPLLDSLVNEIARASRVDLAVAFVTQSGLDQLAPYFLDLLERNGRVRILTGDYLGVTEPRALRQLLDWVNKFGELIHVRIFQTDSELGFHPKAYLIHRDYSGSVAYIGSSNLTKHALTKGLEWNQRLDGLELDSTIKSIQQEFNRLFDHSKSRALDENWIDQYSDRRKGVQKRIPHAGVDLSDEGEINIPTPNPIQAEALAALEKSRARGDKAGLVVMATGLGKTWLAAFDSVSFKRVLFVAHREEILTQALQTFRKIRPDAHFGVYMGGQFDRNADVLFASVQTLGRKNHLRQFSRSSFEYVVVDEFHHAAATTYRRLIDHFDPSFLLGLTATPERTDGGDLLGLCGENLVFRCDLAVGINRELLSPFHYFGVPDEVDFENIPWRSGRFDPQKLEFAMATDRRAQNAYEQWRSRAQDRTLAFCVSKRHADFMANYFLNRGVRSAAVHSGPGSAPRTQTLKQLESKDLQVVFCVDMFNEGVDVPSIDTVMMLRPTESKILWLQQLGRGLRRADGKSHLNVIDYIGNHRTFLQVPMLLLPGAGSRPGEIARALEAVEKGDLELPKGCSVQYELEALNILKHLARPTGTANQITFWYRSFQELHGRRPEASEAWHEGYDPRKLRSSFGSWLGFVKSEGGLDSSQTAAFVENREFFEVLETSPMTKSFKMISLLSMIGVEKFPGSISIERLAEKSMQVAKRVHTLREEFGDALNSIEEMKRLLISNPIAAWVGGKGTKGVKYFTFESDVFESFSVEPELNSSVRDLAREICDYRLSQYLDRTHGEFRFARNIVCKVSHSNFSPMLFLPSRDTTPGIPEGWTPLVVDGEEYQANFVKIAINVVRKEGSERNALPEILRGYFGGSAGHPGTNHSIKFELQDGRYHLVPIGVDEPGIKLWNSYMRADIPPLWGLTFNSSKWNQGYVVDGNHMFLLVTLNKQGMAEEHQYEDRFLSEKLFQWVSQNRTRRSAPSGQKIVNHQENGVAVHLFVRDRGKTPKGKAAPFIYCGDVTFIDWEGDNPITVRWRMKSELPNALLERYSQNQG